MSFEYVDFVVDFGAKYLISIILNCFGQIFFIFAKHFKFHNNPKFKVWKITIIYVNS